MRRREKQVSVPRSAALVSVAGALAARPRGLLAVLGLAGFVPLPAGAVAT